MLKLSSRVKALKPSATLAVDAKAKALLAKGIDIINLSAGEPDFDTPSYIKEACIKALKEGYTKYIPTQGLLSLREAICKKIKEDYGVDYTPNEVIVTTGAKQAIFNLLLALVDNNDEVLVLSPYWVSYPEMITCAGGIPKIIPTEFEKNFEPSIETIEKNITSQTKGIILNSPSNPTGLIYSTDFLKGLVPLIKKHNLWVISDDIYDKLRFNSNKCENILSIDSSLRDRVFIVNGVSKTYAMTGWRIGWALGPKEIIEACAKIQGQSTSHATSFAQKGAEAALQMPEEEILKMVNTFAERAKLLCELLREIPGIKFIPPQGAFYLFAKVSHYYGKKDDQGRIIKNSVDFANYLLEESRVALVPGVAFGEEEFVRISFATSQENLQEACNRIKTALTKLT
ncbi:MAG: pyridoxal phosphate-dependent aminotransferase [Thermodesulfobacteriaceae bacterium]|nr:pyridoxal phosphate-dependent aminotransferase [Thermodesulfobacteriaceae bacterium]